MGRLEPSHQGIALLRVVNRLLADRIVISEDLLSPPAEPYDAQTWPACANPLTSRHLGAHLVALRVGDGVSRVRFAAIQQTFQTLTDRALDVTWTLSSGGAPSARVTLVQQSKTERPSTPLVDSGSGLVEMAYLSALWHGPASHVLLLDAPKRSLHPQALVHVHPLLEQRSTKGESQHLPHQEEGAHPLSQQRADEREGAQILAITHSAFVVPTSDLGAVPLLRRDSTGATEVSALPAEKGLPGVSATKRQDRWGRSVNWPTLFFSSVVLLVDGESEWAALPIWYEQTFHEPLEAVGITLLCVQGKSGKGPAMDDLEQFRIPWVALVDGDSLRLDRNNIWKQLHRVGRLSKADADRAQRRKFPDAVCALRKGYGVFVAGATVDENFDTLIEQLIVEDDLLAELQVAEGDEYKRKVLGACWVASHRSCPGVLDELFATVRSVAHGLPSPVVRR